MESLNDSKKVTKGKEQYVRKMVLRQISYFELHIFFSFLMSFVLQLIALIPTIIMQQIIDQWIPNKDTRMIIFSIALFCLIPVCSTMLSAGYRYYLAIICRKTGLFLSIKSFSNLIYQPVSYFNTTNSSELATYCRSESIRYVSFWLMDVPQMAASILSALLVFAYLFSINWVIALFLLLYIPFAFFPSNYFAEKVKTLTKRIIENNAKMSQIISDSFRAIKSIKSLLLEEVQIQKLESVNMDSVSIWSKVALYDNMSAIWIDNLSDSLFVGVVFGIISYLIVLGKNSIGQLVVVLNYCGKVLAVLKQLITTNYDFKKQMGEYDKLFSILMMPCQNYQEGKDFCFRDKICLDNIIFAYEADREPVLRNLSLEIKRGEWLGIVGASGGGKTTIFDLILNFYQPQSGQITVDGEPVQNISLKTLRTKITKISQEVFLFPGTICENLLLANPQATEEEIQNAIEVASLDGFIHSLPNGIHTNIGENGTMLSGGERQRLALAQGLLRKSEIFLLDEVTANLDRESEREILVSLERMMKSQEITIICISHRLDFLRGTDRVIELKDGKVYKNTTYENYIK